MKVYIGPYRNWFGPYQLADLLCFWVKKVPDEHGFKRHPDWVHDFGTWLSEDKNGKSSWLNNFLQWVDKFKKRKIKIRIDEYDTWSMDHTLAQIALPMLKQLRDTKHGSPMVDIEDVPEELRMTGYDDGSSQFRLKFEDDEQYEKESWEITHRRWEWVLNEMIFAFEHLIDDSWEEKYSSGEIDTISIPCQWDKDGNPTLYSWEYGPNHTYQCDYDGIQKIYERIDNGFRLFGKYYRGLWD